MNQIEELFSITRNGNRLKFNGKKIFTRAESYEMYYKACKVYPYCDIDIINEEE